MTTTPTSEADGLTLAECDPNPSILAAKPEPVRVDYINWRGELAERHILPNRIVYGSTEYHPRQQWLLEAFDLDKRAMRVFALEDMRFLDPAPSALAAARQEIAELREALRTARDDALEEAAAWHDAQVQKGYCGEENAERYARYRANCHHQLSAEAIRAARALAGDRS